MYYPSSENKGADQLRGYREADLRLCFHLCRLLVFPWGGSNIDACDFDCVVNKFFNYLKFWLDFFFFCFSSSLCFDKDYNIESVSV